MIIAVAGACHGSSDSVKSGCGIYLGHEETKGYSDRIRNDSQCSQSSQRAELHAAIIALELALTYVGNGGQWKCELQTCSEPCRVRYVVIKSDSDYLVDSMIGNDRKSQSNEWMTAEVNPVQNQDLLGS
jgi:ribonuclease HI